MEFLCRMGTPSGRIVEEVRHGGDAGSLPGGAGDAQPVAEGKPELDDPEEDGEKEGGDQGEFDEGRAFFPSMDPHELPTCRAGEW